MSRLCVAVILILASVGSIRAEDQLVQSTIESVGLFKNGLAVVSRTIELPGPGTYRLEEVPTPVHGTFFIESTTSIIARSSMQLVDGPMNLAEGSLQDQLAGKSVVLTIKDREQPLTGIVAKIEESKNRWSRDYDQPRYGYYNNRGEAIANPADRFLIIDSPERTLVDQSTITAIKIPGNGNTTKLRKPVLLLTTTDANAPKQLVRISYLSNGLAWAPSYRVDLLDDKKLAIEQTAVVKNELLDLKDVELFLISGYPSIDFAHVTSPLSLDQKWSAFFQQLSQRPGTNRGGAMVQQQVLSNRAQASGDVGDAVMPADESIDIHYESIGKQTLSEGDAMSMSVSSGTSDYDRIVEWIVPDTRDANGRFVDQYQRQQNPDQYEDAAWDAVKFKNPLSFAMTTAPATFMRDGKFLGQQTSHWVNSGEQSTLRITKALSIRTHASEHEEPNNDRQIVYVGGNDFRKVSVSGLLSVENFRKTPVTITIKRQFSGDMTSADESPKVTLREEGVWSVNRRNEMEWTITLAPGEKKELKYAYSVLVDN